MTTADQLTSETTDVLAELIDGVAVFTLNRPERRNAMTTDMVIELARLLEVAESDSRVGAVLLTGAGSAFCAGGDVKEFDARGGEGGAADQLDPERVAMQVEAQRGTVGRMYRMSKPTVAVLPGAAAGAGMGLALAADFRVGCPKTVMVTSFSRVALAGDFGTAWLLDRLVGPARALRYMLLSERIEPPELAQLGLLDRLVEAEDVQQAGLELARSLAGGPRTALAAIKANVRAADGVELDEYMGAEVERHMRTGLTADHREAVRAFVEKREPRWEH